MPIFKKKSSWKFLLKSFKLFIEITSVLIWYQTKIINKIQVLQAKSRVIVFDFSWKIFSYSNFRAQVGHKMKINKNFTTSLERNSLTLPTLWINQKCILIRFYKQRFLVFINYSITFMRIFSFQATKSNYTGCCNYFRYVKQSTGSTRSCSYFEIYQKL